MQKVITIIIATLLVFLIFVGPLVSENYQKNVSYFISAFASITLLFLVESFLAEIRKIEKSRTAILSELEKSEEERLKIKAWKNDVSAIINNINEAILALNKNGKIILFNPRAEELLGVKGEDMFEKTISDLRSFPSAQAIISALPQNLNLEEPFKKEIKTKEGAFIELFARSLELRKNNKGTLVVLRDITKQRTAESAKNEFVSLVAHQMKTPLTSIKWALKMISNGDFGNVAEEQKDIIEKTSVKNESLITLIGDLLDLNKIEEEGYISAKIPSDMNSLIQSVADSYSGQMAKKNIELKFKKSKKRFNGIMMDSNKIKMVVQNLLDNAIKYTPDSGKIEISLSGDEKEIKFQIKDSGMGIPEGQKEKVFEKFFRAANAIKKGATSSGFGLFISKKIIEAHKGRIWFDSKEDKGSTFYFTLPVRS